MKANEFPLVSVVITTKNSASTIADCLKSINEQNYPKEKIEIIVVDNNSSDETVAIARRFTDKIFFKGPERSAQRNFGVQKSQGKYILYLDSDMSLSGEVISQCVSECEKGNLIALYIPERIVGEGFWIKVRDFERSFYNATCIDCVRFVQRDKFMEVGGLDEHLISAEDWDFDRRIKACGKSGIIAAALYHNEGVFSLKAYLQKKRFYIRSLSKYINKWGRDDKIIKKQLGLCYRYFGVFIENGKWKRLFRHPGLILSAYFLRLLVGLCYLTCQEKIS